MMICIYPEIGSRFNALYKLIYNPSISPAHFFTYRYEQAIRISKKITINSFFVRWYSPQPILQLQLISFILVV